MDTSMLLLDEITQFMVGNLRPYAVKFMKLTDKVPKLQ